MQGIVKERSFFALIFLYPLNKKRVEANAAKLREIRAAKEQQ